MYACNMDFELLIIQNPQLDEQESPGPGNCGCQVLSGFAALAMTILHFLHSSPSTQAAIPSLYRAQLRSGCNRLQDTDPRMYFAHSRVSRISARTLLQLPSCLKSKVGEKVEIRAKADGIADVQSCSAVCLVSGLGYESSKKFSEGGG